MSVVWRGYDEIARPPVAVKVLSPQLAGDGTFRDRLRQEALAAARLCHPHITGIFDFGESPLSEQPTVPYVVMELNDGESVSARLHRTGPAGLARRRRVRRRGGVRAGHRPCPGRGAPRRHAGQRDAHPGRRQGRRLRHLGHRRAAGRGPGRQPAGHARVPRPGTAGRRRGAARHRRVRAGPAAVPRAHRPAALAGRHTTEALRAHLYADPEPLPALPGLPPEVADLCLRCLANTPDDRPPAPRWPRAGGGRRLEPLTVGLHPSAPVEQPGGRRARPPGPATRPGGDRLAAPGAGPHAGRGVRRLRAGLRIGTALKVGDAETARRRSVPRRPLARDAAHRRPGGPTVFAGRHRLQAAWPPDAARDRRPELVVDPRAGRGRPGPGGAAAGAGPVARVLRGADCRVRYQVKRTPARDFEAQLTAEQHGRACALRLAVGVRVPGRPATDRGAETGEAEWPHGDRASPMNGRRQPLANDVSIFAKPGPNRMLRPRVP